MSELEKFIYAEELNLPTRIKSVAVREYQTDIGPADYVLFVDRQPVGIVEAKKDTPKSTILDAIRYTFHPQWNLSFDDSDFYLCQTAEPFTIDITVGC